MTAAATIFFAPEWPRHVLERSWSRLVATPRASRPFRASRWLAPLVLLHCAAQLLIPLRRFTYSTDSAWTQRGFNFGWNVMVVEKSGRVEFRVYLAVESIAPAGPSSLPLRIVTQACDDSHCLPAQTTHATITVVVDAAAAADQAR